MNDILKEKLKIIGGDPYSILDLTPSAQKDKIDSNFRNLALKHHPDRTKNPQSHKIFMQMTEAKTFLNDPQLRQQYDHYLATQADNQRRLKQMGQQRRKLAQQLIARQRQQQINQKQEKQINQRRRKFQQQKQRQQLQKQRLKQQIMKQMKPNEYYKSICSLKINWQNTNLKFNNKLLKSGFEIFGKVQQVQIKGNQGTVQFQTIQGVDNAIKQFHHPILKVQYLIPFDKRNRLLKALNSNKKQKVDLSLNSDNLKRLAQIMNRNSNSYSNNKQPITINLEQVLRQQNLYKI